MLAEKLALVMTATSYFGLMVCFCLLPLMGQGQVAVSVTVTQSPFCDSNTGSVSLNASGGLAPYLYSLDGVTFLPSAAFSGLAADLYTAWVIDSNQDTAKTTFGLSNPAAPILTVMTVVPVLCAGGTDGLIEVSASGGLGNPYQFRLNDGPPQANGLFSSLGAGPYWVEVRDPAGCRRYQAIAITQPSPVQGSLLNQTDVDCFNGNNAFVSLSASGGQAGGYQFSLDGNAFQPGGTFTGLTAGLYQPIVEDLDGCRDTFSVQITEPPLLSVGLNSLVGIACFGDSLGQVLASATGGTMPYSFAIDGNNFGNSPLFDSLPAGTYPLSVQDANGCLSQQPVSLTQPSALQLPLVATVPPRCAGDSNGVLSLSPQGGTTPYQLSASLGQVNGTQVTDLPGSAIALLLIDANGCEQRDTFSLNDPAPISVQLTGLSPTCAGLADGSLQATLSGGTGPLQIRWNADPTLTTPSLSSQPAGLYQALVSDSLGCVDSASLSLVSPAPVLLSATVRHDTCSQLRGQVILSAQGGDSSFSYRFEGQWLSDSLRDGLGAGSYQAIATDGQGCADTLTLTITDQAPPILALDSLRPVTCAESRDGFLRVSATGGSGVFQYFWPDLGVNGAALDPVGSGDYRAIVYDGLCSDTLTLSLDAPDTLQVVIDSLRPPACSSDPTGYLSVAVQGGQPPYQYSWDHDASLSGPLAAQLPGGSYTLRIRDGRDCLDTLRATLVNPLALRLTLVPVALRCSDRLNGSITALVGGGIPPYRYLWSTGDTSARLSELGPGTYQFEVVDQSGCTLRDSATITGPTPMRLTVTTTAARCADSTSGGAEVAVAGGSSPYRFYWSDGSRDSLLTGALPGTYVLQVQDRWQCLRDTLVEVPGPEPLAVEVLSLLPSTCARANGLIEVQASGGTPGYRYQWDTPTPQQGPLARDLEGAVPGRRYEVTVTDSAGCQTQEAFDLPDRPAAVARLAPSFVPDGTLLLSEATLFCANLSEGATAYRWRVNDSTIALQGDLSYTARQPGEYRIELIAFDPYFACPDTARVAVTVVSDGRLWVPNVFTPNGDGHNDFLRIQGEGIADFQLTIYNQWGRVVRQFGRIDNSWDGRTASGSAAPEGAYAYRLQVWLNNGQALNQRGTVLLIR
jgi:gliding motility-associated-like protein